MGLNFRIGNRSSEAEWSYSGFNEFRRKIASLIKIDLDEMIGFGGNKDWNTRNIIINDDIILFLIHSDCDGDLSTDQCKKIYPRLLELINMLPDTFMDNYDKKMGKILAEDMKYCAENNKKLIFS